jgi:mRNA-degrading endonuclease RelE of RelBE toxin-antitoxin system
VKKIAWAERARTDIRRLDRDTAVRIFEALHRFAETDQGDIKRLPGESGELRLRVGDHRVRSSHPSRTRRARHSHIRFCR